jgi:hypothetical protein
MRMLSLSLAVALASVAPRVGEAASFDSPSRVIWAALINVCDGDVPQHCGNIGGFTTNTATGPWDIDRDTLPGPTTAFQHSSISGAHAEGTGGVTLEQHFPGASAIGESTLGSDFTLDAPAILSITANVSVNLNAAAIALSDVGFLSYQCFVGVTQIDPTPVTIFFDGFNASGGSGVEQGTRAIHFEQLLAPGTYSFMIRAFAQQTPPNADALSTFSWSGSADLIPVPEPTGLAAAALGLALKRLRGSSARRSRSR